MATNGFHRSENLIKLAEKLHLYNPNNNQPAVSSSNFFNIHSPTIQECTVSKVIPKEQESNSELGTDNNSRRARAAVLVCLFEDQQGNLRVILTKRASTLCTHSGEVALPGGKVEEGDANDTETALREAKEEIGLDRSLVDVVTVLESFTTKDENRREQEVKYMGDQYVLHFFDHETEDEKYIIWALTAGILIKAASIVYQRPLIFKNEGLDFEIEVANERCYCQIPRETFVL